MVGVVLVFVVGWAGLVPLPIVVVVTSQTKVVVSSDRLFESVWINDDDDDDEVDDADEEEVQAESVNTVRVGSATMRRESVEGLSSLSLSFSLLLRLLLLLLVVKGRSWERIKSRIQLVLYVDDMGGSSCPLSLPLSWISSLSSWSRW